LERVGANLVKAKTKNLKILDDWMETLIRGSLTLKVAEFIRSIW